MDIQLQFKTENVRQSIQTLTVSDFAQWWGALWDRQSYHKCRLRLLRIESVNAIVIGLLKPRHSALGAIKNVRVLIIMITIGNPLSQMRLAGGNKFSGTYFGRVGNDISECNQDLSCALSLAGLNFTANTGPVKDEWGQIIPRLQNISRADTRQSLGVNGAGYAITQPRDAFKHLSAMPGEVKFQRGGMLKGGKFFLSAEFDTFRAGEMGDTMTAFGVFLSSFDGSWANRTVWVLGRHACFNICRFEIGSATVGTADGRGGRIAKHTANHGAKLDNFIVALHLAQTQLESEVSRLSRKAISADALRIVVGKVVAGESGKSDNIRDAIVDLFHAPRMGTFGANLWDAFNAFSAYDTHYATRRATEIASAEENAFDSLLSGRGFADRALPHLLELARN